MVETEVTRLDKEMAETQDEKLNQMEKGRNKARQFQNKEDQTSKDEVLQGQAETLEVEILKNNGRNLRGEHTQEGAETQIQI